MSNLAIWKKLLLPPYSTVPFKYVASLHHAVWKSSYCPLHSHPAVEIVYHPSGKGVTRTSRREMKFTEGSAVVYAPREPHDQAMIENGEDLCLQIALPEPLEKNLQEGFLIPFLDHPWLIDEIQHLSRSQTQPDKAQRPVFDLRSTAILLALVHIATEVSKENSLPSSARHVLQAEQFISEHFARIRSLNEVARHVGISQDHLRHLFKQARGQSLIQYLNEVKVRRAKILLTNSPLPLKQIATLSGFIDEYYFSAVFRRLTRIPPGLYRQKSGGKN